MAAIALSRRRANPEPSSEPNVIPFIDVLLVLLIIFMVTAPKPTTDLRVDLPHPGPSIAAAAPPTIISLHRSAGGGVQIFVDSEPVPLDLLGARALSAMLASNPAMTAGDAQANGRVYVRADLEVDYQSVVSAVEGLQAARFQRVAIAAQNADAPVNPARSAQ